MDPRATHRARPATRSGESARDPQLAGQVPPYVESSLGAPMDQAQGLARDAQGREIVPRATAITARQRLPYLPSEDDMAGLDVFGDASPPPPRSRPSRPLDPDRDSGYLPSPGPAAIAGPSSGPLPITLGSPAAAQADTPSPAAVAVAPRPQTLTQQLRSVAPPDVARQAVHELGVLAGELEALPEQLVQSGLARQHQRRYRQAAVAYVGLAERAWEAVAEERLEQSGAEQDYRAQAIEIARQITHMQNDVRMATENPGFRLTVRRPLLWRRRVRLIRAGLNTWMSAVSMPPDPRLMSHGLFQLRGSVGLGDASLLELALFDALLAGINIAGVALAVGLVLLQIPTVLAADIPSAITLAFGAVLVAVAWMLTLLLTIAGRAPLRYQLGATLFTPSHTIRGSLPGSPLVAGLLRGWSGLVMLAGVTAAIYALIQEGQWVRVHVPPPSSADLPHLSEAIGTALVVLAGPAGALLLTAVLLVALPLLLLDQGRLTADLAGNPSWVPRARRSVLRPTIGVLAFLTGGLLVGVYAATTALGLAERPAALLIVVTPTVEGLITWRAVAMLVAAVLPYLLLVELPFRLGMRQWRQRWVASLGTRRAELESHMRRLSTPDPRSGAQDASDDNLRAMQYDMVLLQFYRSKVEETERAPMAPFSLRRALILLALSVLLAIVVDNAGSFLGLLLHNSDVLSHLFKW